MKLKTHNVALPGNQNGGQNGGQSGVVFLVKEYQKVTFYMYIEVIAVKPSFSTSEVLNRSFAIH